MKTHMSEPPKPQNQAPSGRPLIRPKLNVNTPGDAHEQEADATADKVMRMPAPGSPAAPGSPGKPANGRYYDPWRPHVRDPFVTPRGYNRNGEYYDPYRPQDTEPFGPRPKPKRNPYLPEENSGDGKLSTREIPSIQRKCSDCEEEEKTLQRKEDKAPEEDKTLHRKEDKDEDKILQRKEEEDNVLHRKENTDEEMLHRKERTGAETPAGSGLDSYVSSLGSSGRPLPDASREFFEPRFGHDFSDVKIHNDGEAAKSAQSINALAYTTGNNIVFNEGQFAPGSDSGDRLLAHELTHVVQQGGGRMTIPRTVHRKQKTKEVKVLHSTLLSGPGSEQLLLTLNKDSQRGDIIGVGTTDQCVILIQKALNYLYEGDPTYKPLKLQKDYGPLTQHAVTRFQEDRQLMKGTNGAVGPETIEALDREVAQKAELETFKYSAEFADVYDLIDPNKKTSRSVPGTEAGGKNDAVEKDDKTEDSFRLGFEGAGMGPLSISSKTSGAANLTPEIALKLLDNVSKGQLPFKPEFGVGGASWFVIEGNPYVSVNTIQSPIRIEVDITKVKDQLIFREADLKKILNEKVALINPEAEFKYRTRHNIPFNETLKGRQLNGLKHWVRTYSEKLMWEEVGKRVRNSSSKAGEVVYEPGSMFSGTPGKVAVVADPKLIQVKGGVNGLIDQLTSQGLGAQPVYIEAAEKLASKMKWAGKVRAVFRYGGRILIVVGIASDLYNIYIASDKLKVTLQSIGGWAGASAAATAFAELWTPADAAGPVAWALHGVGTLVSGAIGYWIGSSTTRAVYELRIEGEKSANSTQTSGFSGFGGGETGGGGAGGEW